MCASGISYCVAELGEQLAWMSTALASSKDDKITTYSRPSIVKTTSRCNKRLGILQQCWSITHEDTRVRLRYDDDASGGCWQNLFRNPVVVHGYPILRRIISNSGLEIPFDIMVALSNARQLVNFAGRTFAKGFSTMLAVTQIVGNTIWWHLCLGEDKKYISFEQLDAPKAEDSNCIAGVIKLSTSRHILGWSTRVRHMAGESFHCLSKINSLVHLVASRQYLCDWNQ
jgi:hypothetical protein